MLSTLRDDYEAVLRSLLQSLVELRFAEKCKDEGRCRYVLATRDRTMTLCVLLQVRIRPAEIPLVETRFDADCKQRMIFADYVSARTAEELRRLSIWFADTLGNAYIEIPGSLLIWTTGNRPAQMPPPKGQYFSTPGARLLHYLAKHGPEVNATYREIRAAIGVSIDKIGKVVRVLAGKRVLQTLGAGRIRIVNAESLLDLRASAYAAKLAPALRIGAYRAANEHEVSDIVKRAVEAMGQDVIVGAEVAADALTEYLRSDNLRLYLVAERIPAIQERLQLARSRNRRIELCSLYSQELRGTAQFYGAVVADPAFVYAELMAGEHRRLTETAVRLRDEHLAWTLLTD